MDSSRQRPTRLVHVSAVRSKKCWGQQHQHKHSLESQVKSDDGVRQTANAGRSSAAALAVFGKYTQAASDGTEERQGQTPRAGAKSVANTSKGRDVGQTTICGHDRTARWPRLTLMSTKMAEFRALDKEMRTGIFF
ncbi:hypothetical protein VFPPC_17979 [Pochonia chlamydosporia 170]|uniref:Uncharacterized protein n=1 Tax=Pochonia chlamydosporia 170 TaxID=1380566 RepID=A0A219APU4_METCM|nr:hypothetical protein VFPPC_17979 [Pochonia chlamydosporia 170]OWT42828.1 hypothetical protein VFPPC_17979 [Pochonia chlamydosporia 170]